MRLLSTIVALLLLIPIPRTLGDPLEDTVKLLRGRDAQVETFRLEARRIVLVNVAHDPAPDIERTVAEIALDLRKSRDAEKRFIERCGVHDAEGWVNISTVEEGERFRTDQRYSDGREEVYQFDGQLFRMLHDGQLNIAPNFKHMAQIRLADLQMVLAPFLSKTIIDSTVAGDRARLVFDVGNGNTTTLLFDSELSVTELLFASGGATVTKKWFVRDHTHKDYFGPRVIFADTKAVDGQHDIILTNLESVQINAPIADSELKLPPIKPTTLVVDDRQIPANITQASKLAPDILDANPEASAGPKSTQAGGVSIGQATTATK